MSVKSENASCSSHLVTESLCQDMEVIEKVLTRKEQCIHMLKTDLERLKSEVNHLASENEHYKSEKKNYETIIRDHTELIRDITSKEAMGEKELTGLKQNIEMLSQAQTAAKNDLEAKIQENKAIRMKLEETEVQVIEQQRIIDAKGDEIKKLAASSDRLTAQLAEERKKSQNYQRELEKLKQAPPHEKSTNKKRKGADTSSGSKSNTTTRKSQPHNIYEFESD